MNTHTANPMSALEMDIASSLDVDLKEGYMNTLLKNAEHSEKRENVVPIQKAKPNGEGVSTIPVGPFKGQTSKEAIQSVVKINENLPSNILEVERQEALIKIAKFNDQKKELIATNEVRTKSISSAMDHKIDSLKEIVSQRLKDISDINKQIDDFNNQINRMENNKMKMVNQENAVFDKEIRRIDQLIESHKLFVESLN